MSENDWLSHFLQLITVTGQLEVRCTYSGPWRVAWSQTAAHEIPYHIVLNGRAVLEDLQTQVTRELAGGDIVLLPHGSAHVLHDGSGRAPAPNRNRRGAAGWMVSANDGEDAPLELLCGRLFVEHPHGQILRDYLPANLVVRAMSSHEEKANGLASSRLASLVSLMRIEAAGEKPGGSLILNAFSSALFTLALRTASESGQAPPGLSSLVGDPRLTPAISAMFADPAHAWTLSELAGLCGVSRDTFIRHFHDKLGRSAVGLLADIRMSLAANRLKNTAMSAAEVAGSVGYRSLVAFRRVFTGRIGMTPMQWRRLAHEAG
jgi:AraC family transcriptional activator of mtrCDE